MSKISTVYDTVLSTLSTLFSSKTRIPNPYFIEDNASQFLANGYGLKILPEANADSEFCTFSRIRTFAVTFSREVIQTESETSQLDIAIKALVEDVYILQKYFINPNQLGIESSIEKIDIGGTTGIEFFSGERTNLIVMDVLFLIQITDDI